MPSRCEPAILAALQVRGYFSAFPAGFGSARRQRSGPSVAEARAALEVLKGLSVTAGGEEKTQHLEFLSVCSAPCAMEPA